MLAQLFTESSFAVSLRSVELLGLGIKVEFASRYITICFVM